MKLLHFHIVLGAQTAKPDASKDLNFKKVLKIMSAPMFLSVIQLPHSRGRSYKKQVCPASLGDSEEIFWKKEARTVSFYD